MAPVALSFTLLATILLNPLVYFSHEKPRIMYTLIRHHGAVMFKFPDAISVRKHVRVCVAGKKGSYNKHP